MAAGWHYAGYGLRMRRALAYDIGPRARNKPAWRAQERFFPAPTQGMDTDSPVAELPTTLARRLENWIPKGVSLEMRKGWSPWVTGNADAVETIMAYVAGGTSALFAAADDSIYNITSTGAIGAAVVGSLTSARFSYVNFTTSGGAFLWICNGADDPRHWNGTTWATPSLTVTTFTDNDIIHVSAFKERLFFLFKDSLTFGYLATQAIAGTVSNFPLGAVFAYGGRLLDSASLSRDGGDGLDDLKVFLTSEGEIAVYQGTNPGSATEWALVGTYYVGEPIGDRPLVELGDDLGVITLNGLVSVKTIMAGSQQETPPLSARIGTAWQEASATGRGFDGWEGIWVPSEDLLLINAPDSATTAEQFIRHRVTGGWSKFTGWDFLCYEFYEGRLYAGSASGEIVRCFDGYDDNGSDITAAIDTAWSTLGVAQNKTLLEVRTVATTTTRAAYRLVARTDFEEHPALPAFPTSTLTNACIWGTGLWGTHLWGGQDSTSHQWRAISGDGFSVSLIMESRSNQSRFALNGWTLRFAVGGQV